MEKFIREVAKLHGLEVAKRITTGNETKHFATFELTGDSNSLDQAWKSLAPRVPKGSAVLTFCDNPEHKDFNKPFIEIQSIWCDLTH